MRLQGLRCNKNVFKHSQSRTSHTAKCSNAGLIFANRVGSEWYPSRDKKSKARTAVERMCGLSTVVTPAGASLTMYREIRSYANSIWDDNNNNNSVTALLTRRFQS